jgi:hypothetical protein
MGAAAWDLSRHREKMFGLWLWVDGENIAGWTSVEAVQKAFDWKYHPACSFRWKSA